MPMELTLDARTMPSSEASRRALYDMAVFVLCTTCEVRRQFPTLARLHCAAVCPILTLDPSRSRTHILRRARLKVPIVIMAIVDRCKVDQSVRSSDSIAERLVLGTVDLFVRESFPCLVLLRLGQTGFGRRIDRDDAVVLEEGLADDAGADLAVRAGDGDGERQRGHGGEEQTVADMWEE
jgi:hypothetical protein